MSSSAELSEKIVRGRQKLARLEHKEQEVRESIRKLQIEEQNQEEALRCFQNYQDSFEGTLDKLAQQLLLFVKYATFVKMMNSLSEFKGNSGLAVNIKDRLIVNIKRINDKIEYFYVELEHLRVMEEDTHRSILELNKERAEAKWEEENGRSL